jgi:putative sigma-54 modulation protein
MNIKFTSKNVKFTEAMKSFVTKRLKAIEKISGDIIQGEVIVNEEKLDYRSELILKTRLSSYHIEESDPILKQALRNTLNTLKLKAKKDKEKIKLEKKRKTKQQVNLLNLEPEDIREYTDESNQEKITISDNYSRKPLSVDEAIFFLKESKENAYMFINAENNNIAVVYFNRNNSISIIEARI